MGMQSALDRVAYGHVFVLYFFADSNTFAIVFLCGGGDVTEVVVKHHGALIHAHWEHEICIHHAFISIDHEIWIDPQIKRPALARGPYASLCVLVGRKRAGL